MLLCDGFLISSKTPHIALLDIHDTKCDPVEHEFLSYKGVFSAGSVLGMHHAAIVSFTRIYSLKTEDHPHAGGRKFSAWRTKGRKGPEEDAGEWQSLVI